jgi:hypothetical protein
MGNNEQRVLVIGLPGTGKSSFIQALDEVLKHPPSAEALCADGLAHDRSYIQDGKPKFLAGEKLVRTDRQLDNTSVELCFKHPPSGLRGRLHLPDEKGEVFRDQWVNRRWEESYAASLAGIAGALVFLRADEKSRNDERLGALAKEILKSGAERPFEMKEASAQVQLVDVLQFLIEHGSPPKPLRVAVLISAWDTVGHEGDLRPKDPTQFLEREWALVSQYLRANPESFTPKVYGVSAYGGVPGQLGALAEQAPHERALLVEPTGSSHDLTRPLRWLLHLD